MAASNNKRIFFSCHQAGIASDGSTSFTVVHGAQSASMNTNFALTDVFSLGQLEAYSRQEIIPTVECTLSKVLDGYPLIYHLATQDSTTPTLAGRSNSKCLIALAIFSDTATGASGTPQSQVQMSGMFPNSLNYSFPLDDKFTETVGFVGNNKIWANDANNLNGAPWGNATSLSFTGAFSSNDSPIGSGGVNYRQNLLLTPRNINTVDANGMLADSDCTILPPDVFGISSSGVNKKSNNQDYDAHLAGITVSADLTREELNELGRRGPYHRAVQFPIEVTCEIQTTSTSGDMVSATEAGIRSTGSGTCSQIGNLQDRTIRIATCEGTRLYLGMKNKLSAVSYSGGDAGGGNVTVSYTFSNYNSLTIMHSGDPNANFTWAGRDTYLLN